MASSVAARSLDVITSDAPSEERKNFDIETATHRDCECVGFEEITYDRRSSLSSGQVRVLSAEEAVPKDMNPGGAHRYPRAKKIRCGVGNAG